MKGAASVVAEAVSVFLSLMSSDDSSQDLRKLISERSLGRRSYRARNMGRKTAARRAAAAKP